MLDRRSFCRRSVGLLAAGALASPGRLRAEADSPIQFTLDLCPGRIGVGTGQRETIELAAKYGFGSVEPVGGFLAGLADGEMERLRGELAEKNLVWGAGGFPVDLRAESTAFDAQLKSLAGYAAALQRAGATRVGTWIPPSSRDLTYRSNFRRYVQRMRAAAGVLGDHGLRIGLEYIGPKTLWSSGRFPFVHTLVEAQELISEIGADNVGVVLDSWHWYTAGETVDDLLALTKDDVVAVDLNDAPAGVPVDEQIDSRRTLPLATGVIDLQGFMEALVQIGFDGPVRAEPFNRELNALDDEPAVQATATAMKQTFALVGA